MSAQRYFPNGNPDYESPWLAERNSGWVIVALSLLGLLAHHYWLDPETGIAKFILAMSYVSWGIGFTQIRLGTRGRDQAETLQEREGEIDWALDKLRDNNIEY